MINQASTNHLIDQEAEDAVIGGFLLDGELAMEKAYKIGLSTSHFADARARRFYQTMIEMDPTAIDWLTVKDKMQTANLWHESEGDGQYLERVVFDTPLSLYVDWWGQRIIDMYKRRQMLIKAQQLATAAVNLTQPVEVKIKQPGAVFYYDKRP